MVRVRIHDHPDVLQLLTELTILRERNKKYKSFHPSILLFSECAVALVTFERLVRLAVPDAGKMTLWPLLEKGVSLGIIELPYDDQQRGIKEICDVSNSLLHGNYEQAGVQINSTARDYFQRQFASEVEALGKIALHMAEKLDPNFKEDFYANLQANSKLSIEGDPDFDPQE